MQQNKSYPATCSFHSAIHSAYIHASISSNARRIARAAREPCDINYQRLPEITRIMELTTARASISLLGLAALAALVAAAAAPCWTATQLPNPPSVVKLTRQRPPAPEHFVPAGSWTDSCCEVTSLGACRTVRYYCCLPIRCQLFLPRHRW